MALTPGVVSAALSFASTVTINNPSVPYNTIQPIDATNWLGGTMSLTAGVDTAKMLMKIVDPLGIVVYENAGYAADNYGAPDIQFNINTFITANALPVITGTPTVISGVYSVNVKVRVVKGADPAVDALKTFSTNVQYDQLIRTPALTSTYDCDSNPTYFKVTDTTDLGATLYAYVSIDRELTITPPVASGQSPVTGATNSLTINNLWAPAPYQYGVVATVTFGLGVDTFEVYYTLDGSMDVVCGDLLCKIYCCLLKLRNDFYAEVNGGKKEIIHERIFLGQLEYNLAVRARLCGDSAAVASYVAKFYEVTLCDPNCDCCDDTGPAPVISVIAGPAGPAGATGATGAIGATGATGAAGAAGAGGTSVLTNQYPVLSTLGLAFESLIANAAAVARNPWVLPANTLNTDMDEIFIHASFSTSSWTSAAQLVRLLFNGSAMNTPLNIGFYAKTIDKIIIDVRLTRTSNTTAKYEMVVKQYTTNIGGSTIIRDYYQTIVALAGLNFTTNPYNIDAQGDSVVIGDVTCNAFEVVYKHKV